MAAGEKTKKKRIDGFGIFKGAKPFSRDDFVTSCFIENYLDKKKVKK